MLRRLYDWTMSLADHPKALWALALVSFIEASVFPIPPDVLMIPMVLAAPRRAWLIALVATGALAAALSTAAGLLLVISSSIAHDLYVHFFDPDASVAMQAVVGLVRNVQTALDPRWAAAPALRGSFLRELAAVGMVSPEACPLEPLLPH